MNGLKIDYVDCSCNSPDHVLRFSYDLEENELWIEIQLIQYRNIFKRMWVAIKYIFGYQCRYGHWDCWLLNPKDCEKIQNILQRIVDNIKINKNEDIKKCFLCGNEDTCTTFNHNTYCTKCIQKVISSTIEKTIK